MRPNTTFEATCERATGSGLAKPHSPPKLSPCHAPCESNSPAIRITSPRAEDGREDIYVSDSDRLDVNRRVSQYESAAGRGECCVARPDPWLVVFCAKGNAEESGERDEAQGARSAATET